MSCFDLWHFALNRFYVPKSDADAEQFDNDVKAAEEGSEDALLLKQKLRQSWLAIFVLDQSKADMGRFESKSIQGCFWTLKHSCVIAVLDRNDLDSYAKD
ncbi:DUF3841 domain-containing protein [Pseudomonas sp. GG8]